MRSARLIPARRPAVVLVAHGSRDPRAAVATEALARAVHRARPDWTVRASYLDHAGPRPLDVLASLPAGSRAALVPLLLTSAYHGRVDLPAVVEAARPLPVRVGLTEVLGPAPGAGPVSPLLLSALWRRLAVTEPELDAVVLASAGTRDAAARRTVADAAAAFGRWLGIPAAVAYASGEGPNAGEAVTALRAAGARRPAMAAYFLAPGLLYDTAARTAREAGAVAVAEPLGAVPELVRLVAARADSVLGHVAASAA
ncbi:CbiX/SirB N-terminal domain-containing protein [Actinoplanes sp. NBRC 101535]|uniref:sirohydrochlorin chelatase n=1 Tax=Actinoplanes sp. NBRC 101535 TaxID=3032196 RepID=UPI0024A28147|nr:CbiX/SirB N-terminal domain-containing protein [Actinoplanes sp. NBRC 101535]GLY03502.1 cobalamin biosynthesis protein [Actinoplanes sp. NBRC 101535]